MKNFLTIIILLALGMFSMACYEMEEVEPDLAEVDMDHFQIADIHFSNNGKVVDASELPMLYTPDDHVLDKIPALKEADIIALKNQLQLLKYRSNQSIALGKDYGELFIDDKLLANTVQTLLNTNGAVSRRDLAAYKINGQDGKGNVKYTGYFTPVVQVSKVKTTEYKYPIYRFPAHLVGKSFPTRKQIDVEGQLENQNLELAYAKNPVDIYIMHVQGSAIVEYRDGTRERFAFSGSNRKSYKSIGQYMIQKGYITIENSSLKYIKSFLNRNPHLVDEVLSANPSYVFFKAMKDQPKGAGMVNLSQLQSIAVDTRYIPLGSILLGSVPVIRHNKVIGHEYKLLVAQDIGAAINGSGHIDLYTGVGNHAHRLARNLHHYGSLWLLLSPSTSAPIAMLQDLSKVNT